MSWSKNPQTAYKVLEVCQELCEASLAGFADHNSNERSMALSQLSSARLSAQVIHFAIRSLVIEFNNEKISPGSDTRCQRTELARMFDIDPRAYGFTGEDQGCVVEKSLVNECQVYDAP